MASPTSEDQLAIGHALERVVSWLREARKPAGLSASALSVLAHLSSTGPMRVTVLADREGISQPGMTTLVDRLTKAGLTIRSSDPADKRVVLVSITDEGGEKVTAYRAARAELIAMRILELPTDDQAALGAAVPALDRFSAERTADATTEQSLREN